MAPSWSSESRAWLRGAPERPRNDFVLANYNLLKNLDAWTDVFYVTPTFILYLGVLGAFRLKNHGHARGRSWAMLAYSVMPLIVQRLWIDAADARRNDRDSTARSLTDVARHLRIPSQYTTPTQFKILGLEVLSQTALPNLTGTVETKPVRISSEYVSGKLRKLRVETTLAKKRHPRRTGM